MNWAIGRVDWGRCWPGYGPQQQMQTAAMMKRVFIVVSVAEWDELNLDEMGLLGLLPYGFPDALIC